MKRNEALAKKKLLGGMPYSKAKLEEFTIGELKMLASLLNINSWQKTKEHLVRKISKDQHELDLLDEKSMSTVFISPRFDLYLNMGNGLCMIYSSLSFHQCLSSTWYLHLLLSASAFIIIPTPYQ